MNIRPGRVVLLATIHDTKDSRSCQFPTRPGRRPRPGAYSALFVRDAVPADYPAIRRVIVAAYRQYADLIARDIFRRTWPTCSTWTSTPGTDASSWSRRRARSAGSVSTRTFRVEGFRWPPGWAGGRALAVHPDARGHGVARALLAACQRLARDCGAPVFGFHTASFMTGAIALYERLGYRLGAQFDFDMAARYSRFGAAPIMSIAYLRRRAPERAACALFPFLEALMTTNARIRRVSSPAYYLARPAALWLAAFAPRPEARPADRSSCTSEGRGPAAHGA